MLNFMKPAIFGCLFVSAAGLSCMCGASRALGADVVTAWMRLSEGQKSEVRQILAETLPAAIPEAQSYADALANDIPRWASAAVHLEQGEYIELIGSFEKELQAFVIEYLDDQLPDDGMARWSLEKIKDNSAIMHRLFLVMADPTKEWEDVSVAFWNEVQQRVDDESNRILERFVRDAINGLAGTDEGVLGYTPGDLYILAVREWAGEVGKWNDETERAAANELYRIYQTDRLAAGQSAAENHVLDGWATLYPVRDDGSRASVMNLSLTLTPTGRRLGVSPQHHDELARRLLTLCDKFWNTPEGQTVYTDRDKARNVYYRFHEWVVNEAQRKVRQHRIQQQKQSEERFQLARQTTQLTLADIHRRAAVQLRAAIEQQLTAGEKADRDAAMAIAERLLNELAADVQKARNEQGPFLEAVGKLKDVTDRVSSVQDVFRGGLAEELEKIRQGIAKAGNLAATLEQQLKGLYTELEAAEAEVVSAEQAATDACSAGQGVLVASSREKAFEQLQMAVMQTSFVKDAAEQAAPGLFLARHQALALEQQLQQRERQSFGEMASLRGLHWVLAQVDTALTTWNEYRQLEMEWMDLFGGLTAQVNHHRQLQTRCRRTAEYIQAILAPHNPNDAIIGILQQVGRHTENLDAVQAEIVTAWDEKWAWRDFPQVDLPNPAELQAARQFCDTYRHLLKPAGEALDAIDQRIQQLDYLVVKLTERNTSALALANLCLIKAIHDYDQIWLKGENTERIVRGTEPSGARDTVLPPGEGEITLNQPDTVLPSGAGEVMQDRPNAGQDQTTTQIPAGPGTGETVNVPSARTFDGTYAIYENTTGTRRNRAQPFDTLTWKSSGEDRAVVTLVMSSSFPDAALSVAEMKRNVSVTVVRRMDSAGNYYFTASGGELTQTVRGTARLAAQIAAGAGRAFGNTGSGALQVNVRQATVTITPLEGDELRVVVHSDTAIQVGGRELRSQKDQEGIARRATAQPSAR